MDVVMEMQCVYFICKGYLYKYAGLEAKGSNPITGLTLLWARNPFRGNFNRWQVSRKEAGQNVRPERVNKWPSSMTDI
jgi:hypothetical protein